jgi:cellulose synthase/poly-beta-1,6-N-acetylglucosamine synthase-like glycosyltransferase
VISFVVPAHNEEALIGRTLAAIAAAAAVSGENWEIIVVDDSSVDATAAIAEAAGARVIHVDYRQIARTRNAGARVAHGEILIFVDADTIIDAKVVSATLRALAAGAVGGGAALRFDGRIPWHGRVLIWLVRSGMRAARLAAGCYVFSRRDVFEAVGGFDEKLFAGEELALSRALAKQGRVVILRESVLSSGRKLRTHSGWEILRLIAAVTVRGQRSLHSRDDLDLWYGGRRRE